MVGGRAASFSLLDSVRSRHTDRQTEVWWSQRSPRFVTSPSRYRLVQLPNKIPFLKNTATMKHEEKAFRGCCFFFSWLWSFQCRSSEDQFACKCSTWNEHIMELGNFHNTHTHTNKIHTIVCSVSKYCDIPTPYKSPQINQSTVATGQRVALKTPTKWRGKKSLQWFFCLL